jgi:hypothetical protein
MRSVAEYVGIARDFEIIAEQTTMKVLNTAYLDLGKSYRELARVRERQLKITQRESHRAYLQAWQG